MSYKILIIDDEPLVVKSVARILEGNGYKVFTALNGNDGVSCARKHQPDLIILDIMMPVMDGFSTLKMLRQDLKTKDIGVIMFTTRDQADDVVKCMVDGHALDFIVKPFICEELLDRLRIDIAKRKRMMENAGYQELTDKVKKVVKK